MVEGAEQAAGLARLIFVKKVTADGLRWVHDG
jgi:hypothetical protein